MEGSQRGESMHNGGGTYSGGGTFNEGGTSAFFGQSMQREEIYSSGGSSRGEILSSGGSSTQVKEGGVRARNRPAINDSDDDDDNDDDDEEEVSDVETKAQEYGHRPVENTRGTTKGRGVMGVQVGPRTTGVRRKTTTAAEEEKEYRELYALPTPSTGGTFRDEVHFSHTQSHPLTHAHIHLHHVLHCIH